MNKLCFEKRFTISNELLSNEVIFLTEVYTLQSAGKESKILHDETLMMGRVGLKTL